MIMNKPGETCLSDAGENTGTHTIPQLCHHYKYLLGPYCMMNNAQVLHP